MQAAPCAHTAALCTSLKKLSCIVRVWQARVGYYWYRKVKAQCEKEGNCQVPLGTAGYCALYVCGSGGGGMFGAAQYAVLVGGALRVPHCSALRASPACPTASYPQLLPSPAGAAWPLQMGGFTRLLHSGQEDDLMKEVPTVVVNPLPPEHPNHGCVGGCTWLAGLGCRGRARQGSIS